MKCEIINPNPAPAKTPETEALYFSNSKGLKATINSPIEVQIPPIFDKIDGFIFCIKSNHLQNSLHRHLKANFFFQI